MTEPITSAHRAIEARAAADMAAYRIAIGTGHWWIGRCRRTAP